MVTGSSDDAVYVVGRTEHERKRLVQQSELYASFTRRFLAGAGIAPSMRVLDIGCGVGDVSLLAASLVGPEGAVVGVDADQAALDVARERAAEVGCARAAFLRSDLRDLSFDEPFDAVIGRFVLMYLGDPAAALRVLTRQVRPGGIVAFQEFDFTAWLAMPASSNHDQIIDWWRKTAGAAGLELQMGLKLYQTYQAAGLPAPTLQADMLIGGGTDFGGYSYLANVIRSILPLMERFGVATAEEVDVDTLATRFRDEVVNSGGCAALPLIVGASTHVSWV